MSLAAMLLACAVSSVRADGSVEDASSLAAMKEQMARLQAELARRDAEVTKREAELAKRDETIAALNAKTEDHRAGILPLIDFQDISGKFLEISWCAGMYQAL